MEALDMLRTTHIFLAIVILLSLSACGTNLIAPEGKAVRIYLEKVQDRCGTFSIGGSTIATMFDFNSDSYFLDITSKLGKGTMSETEYTDAINSTYPTDNNKKGINCIFSQLGEN
jgi:hypothetical protein